MSGLPFQDEKHLLEDIALLLSYAPAHVSFYALTVEPETPLGLRAAAGGAFLPQQDEADHLWLCGSDALEKSGYAQYEVSNFCLQGNGFPATQCQHNLQYWRMLNWLALGPSASGTIICDKSGTGLRYTYPSNIDNWQEPLTEKLDSLTLMKETFLMGFRLTDGPDEDLFFKRFHRSIPDCIPGTISAWENRGLLRQDKTALNKEGLLLLDRFLVEAFRELQITANQKAGGNTG
jgi:oxygen-independent coproporphyrinogen-3 oxidase